MRLGAAEAWLLAGLGLLLAELALPGVYLVWIGVAAAGTGLLTRALGWELGPSVLCFCVLTAACLAAATGRRRSAQPAVPVNTAASGLVGRVAVVTVSEAEGLRVRVGDSDWAASSAVPQTVGAALRVQGVDGTTLRVG